MKKILLIIASIIAITGFALTTFASSLPVGGQTYYLSGAGINATQTTIQLTSLKTPDGTLITMSNFGTKGYGTLEPQTNAKIEFIDFTGITQNANGTATLTGVTRGVGFVYPYASLSSLEKAHAGGAVFSVTNTPEFYYDEFVMQNNSNLFTWPSASSSPASKGYVDYIAFSGAGVIPATMSVPGVSQLATQLQAASSTVTNGSGYNLVIPSSIATSTYNQATAPLRVVVTQNSGKIDNNFIATSTLFSGLLPTPTVGNGADGNITFNGTSIYTFAATTSATVYNLSRSIFANNITISSGITLNTNGYQIFAAGTISGSGIFAMNGNNASGQSGGAASGAFFSTVAGGSGGNGGTNVGGSGANSSVSVGVSGHAGGGGASGGAGGAVGVVTPLVRAWGNLATDVYTGSTASTTTSNGLAINAITIVPAGGASGGGGGGGTGSPAGGGAGASGGIVEIIANVLSGSWNIQATGGTGAGGSAGSGGTAGAGGGAGGNGGVCVTYYNTSTWTGTCSNGGGSGGAGGAVAGSAGTSGANGVSFSGTLASLLR